MLKEIKEVLEKYNLDETPFVINDDLAEIVLVFKTSKDVVNKIKIELLNVLANFIELNEYDIDTYSYEENIQGWIDDADGDKNYLEYILQEEGFDKNYIFSNETEITIKVRKNLSKIEEINVLKSMNK